MSEFPNLNEISKQIDNVIDKLQSRSSIEKIARMLARLIKVRTRLGYGSEGPDSSRRALKPLKRSTKNARRYKKKAGRLSRETTPNRSNLTDTGQLLDSLFGRYVKKGRGEVGLLKNRRGSRANNEEVAEYVQKDRPFLEPTKEEVDQLRQRLRKDLRNLIRKGLTRTK